MKTIVSVTPLALEADSRTYKEAASFARLGYRSIVVEGAPTSLPLERLPFELRTLPRAAASPPPASGAERGEAAAWLPDLVRRAGREPYGAARWLLSRFRERGTAGRALPPASLYVLHEFTLFPAVRRAARRNSAPIVYDAHDLYSTLAAEQKGEPGYVHSVAKLRNLLERRCVRAAAAHMTVAPRLAKLQQERFGRRFAVVRNAHDPRLDQDSPATIREVTAAPPGSFLVAIVGNAKPSMAINEMLEALTRLPDDVCVAFVGRRYEPYAAAAAALGLADRAAFPGAVAPTQVASFLRGADLAASIYVPSSVNALNALPNGFLQSVAAGLPILYPRLPEIEAVAAEYRLGLPIDPRDPAEIAARLLQLRDDSEAMSQYRAAAAAAASELTWEREEPELARVVASAIEAGGPTGDHRQRGLGAR